jgi:multidrug transporter EmrE-like cation transporter
MSLNSLAFIIASVTLSAVAQIAFKFGVSSAAGQAGRLSLGALSALLTPGVIIGLALYGVGTLLWLTALERVELSQAYPFVGIGFALTTLAGWWLFGDSLSTLRLVGIALVVGGIVLVAWN